MSSAMGLRSLVAVRSAPIGTRKTKAAYSASLYCRSIRAREWDGKLEQDEYFLRAKRIEIPSSITACEFYKKLGNTHKNGIAVIDDEQIFRLEKFRSI